MSIPVIRHLESSQILSVVCFVRRNNLESVGKKVCSEVKPLTFANSLGKGAIRKRGEGRVIPRRFVCILTGFNTLLWRGMTHAEKSDFLYSCNGRSSECIIEEV